MTIGIIGAMDSEIELYLNNIENCEEVKFGSFCFYKGILEGKEIVLVKSGIGKVNAACCTQLLIDKFSVSQIIFTGVAGSINPEIKVRDVIVSTGCIHHDVDATVFGYKKGQIPQMDLEFVSSSDLACKVFESTKELGLNISKGVILTGDQFISNKELTRDLREVFSADCIDMESAAVAQVCCLNNIPHVIIRSISDNADEKADISFDEFEKIAANNSYNIVNNYLGSF